MMQSIVDIPIAKFVFARGEFDMVIFDRHSSSCSIYEVKHSVGSVKEQYAQLIDDKNCKDTEFRYGPITGRYVIYRGTTKDIDGIHYINVEEYLKGLSKDI